MNAMNRDATPFQKPGIPPERDAHAGGARTGHPAGGEPPMNAEALLHELQVHQVELEMQNEELRNSRILLEISRDRYADLYDFAPFGYATLGANGLILEANLTIASYFGVARANLPNYGFGRFVAPEDQERWYMHLMQVLNSRDGQGCDLSLRRRDDSRFEGRLESIRIPAEDGAAHPFTIRIALSDISELKKAEKQLSANAERLDQMSRHLASVQEQERRRLSSELHDRTSPNLAALKLNLGLISAALEPSQRSALQALLADTRALLDDTTESIHDVGTDLRPPVLDYAGLLAAIETCADKLHRRSGISVSVDGSRFTTRPSLEQETLLFRIACEALTNCAKHAHATTVNVVLANEGAGTMLSIADNGIGFEKSMPGPSAKSSGLGLITMRERAEYGGGTFHIESMPGQGTRIEVRI